MQGILPDIGFSIKNVQYVSSLYWKLQITFFITVTFDSQNTLQKRWKDFKKGLPNWKPHSIWMKKLIYFSFCGRVGVGDCKSELRFHMIKMIHITY